MLLAVLTLSLQGLHGCQVCHYSVFVSTVARTTKKKVMVSPTIAIAMIVVIVLRVVDDIIVSLSV